MNRFPLKAGWLLAMAALMMAGCGTGNRELESLSVSPSTATAKGVPVQFTATGYWSEAPTVETPMAATWGACTTDGALTTDVTVTSAGLATCASGAKGTFSVWAQDPQYGSKGPTCNVISACNGGCGLVWAGAQLTCP